MTEKESFINNVLEKFELLVNSVWSVQILQVSRHEL